MLSDVRGKQESWTRLIIVLKTPTVKNPPTFFLERKVRGGFALAAAVLILVGALTYISVVRFAEDAWPVDHTHQVLNSLSELVSSLTSAESVQLSYLLTGSEDYLKSFEAAVVAADQQVGRLRKLTPDNSNQQSKLTAFEPVIAQRLARGETIHHFESQRIRKDRI